MHCICIFWVCQLEVLPKQCSFYTRLREVRFRSGSGFRSSSLENIIKKKRIAECIVDETLIKVGSELAWHRVAIESKPPNSRTNRIQGEKHVCHRTFSVKHCHRPWKTPSFNRWWHMESSILWIPKTRSSYTFFI
jgi:hypothetical protein